MPDPAGAAPDTPELFPPGEAPIPHGHDAAIQVFYRQKYIKLESRAAIKGLLGAKS